MYSQVPVNLLRASRIFVFEPPPGVKANLLRTFSAVPASRMCQVSLNESKSVFHVRPCKCPSKRINETRSIFLRTNVKVVSVLGSPISRLLSLSQSIGFFSLFFIHSLYTCKLIVVSKPIRASRCSMRFSRLKLICLVSSLGTKWACSFVLPSGLAACHRPGTSPLLTPRMVQAIWIHWIWS